MDRVDKNARPVSRDPSNLNEKEPSVLPCEALTLSEDDIAAVLKDIDKIKNKLENPMNNLGRPGMVFDGVVGWVAVKDNGDKVRVAVKKPVWVKAERLESDLHKRQQKLVEAGEYRFVPTYRLPGQELMVQRLVEGRQLTGSELHDLWNDFSENKGFSVSQIDDNVLYDRQYGPVIIDVINVHWSA